MCCAFSSPSSSSFCAFSMHPYHHLPLKFPIFPATCSFVNSGVRKSAGAPFTTRSTSISPLICLCTIQLLSLAVLVSSI
ncbi:uncharacterized protein BO88DRAFT_208980 [Aspergillus vadensis CBS 113365]|uniref:Uncharacterized protein n=1 Tax=Aspergillus vadensis (strain CBS 113365 / IMI 142717 / IBT 24658) TaxID=1448311 RepID=A0A319BK12_ASPVC|nr:hypothetical protein BO88DRAFT_208980 [Aspergillus vadensis CBS 113365]PYH72249.1 hypothetical protein BO88DRAFT_208980 [Aspergillus vadensis CBS 113365]